MAIKRYRGAEAYHSSSAGIKIMVQDDDGEYLKRSDVLRHLKIHMNSPDTTDPEEWVRIHYYMALMGFSDEEITGDGQED